MTLARGEAGVWDHWNAAGPPLNNVESGVFNFLRRGKKEEQDEQRLAQGVQKTRTSFFGRLAAVFQPTGIGDETWDELEEALIGADVGVRDTEEILDHLRDRHRRGELRTGEQLQAGLAEELVECLRPRESLEELLPEGLCVVLVVGVNGVGKTTTIAKLGNYWRDRGRNVLLAAGDTFRAAAAEQLEIWAERVGLPCVGSRPGADPGAVIFDAIGAAKARGHDLVIADTAGRLHTKVNLMEELRKIRRVIDRHEVACRALLVLDATTGQNGLAQAMSFADTTGLDGAVVTKLDGTARGGVLVPIVQDLDLPVLFLGTGESVADLVPFDPEAFVRALIGTNQSQI
jgi:fused signal recognition particle receptor